MTEHKRAGQLDPDYGNNGQTSIPPEPPRNPDIQTLQQLAQAAGVDGSTVLFGHNPDDPQPESPLFTRLSADGKWDDVIGHVGLEPVDAPDVPDNLFGFTTLFPVEIDNKTNYLTVSNPVYFDYATGDFLYYVAVGRFDEHFRPVSRFGTGGLSFPSPGDPWEVLAKPAKKTVRKRDTETLALFYKERRPIALSNNFIRVIYPRIINDTETTTWIALFNPETGDLDLERELKDNGGNPIALERAEFLSDGSFLLLALREDRNTAVLRRYFDNGLPDTSFAGGAGEIEFSARSRRQFGMDVKNGRIVVSAGFQNDLDQPTSVYCFSLDGKIDPDFNNARTLEIGRGLKLDHVRFDTQGRIVLAGTQHSPPTNKALSVVRLNSDGSRDDMFGEGGFFDGAPYYAAANDLFVTGNEIRVLSLSPRTGSLSYEMMLKLTD